jgi:GNAT superfamily N-acetyltransferase
MMLVAERHARKGVGRRLMKYVVGEGGTVPLTLYATPNGRPLYQELGFEMIGSAEMVHGRFQPPGEIFGLTTRPATADDMPALLRLDSEVFGADRTHMITRLPAFADRLWVAVSPDGQIIGYAAAWPNGQTHVIGPLIASDVRTAKALVTSLASDTDRVVRTDIDVRHEELLSWLKDHGVESVAFNAVMAHGIPDLPGDWTRRFAPLTVAAG